MGNLQVKDIPVSMHDELRRRARDEGINIRDYVLRLIETDQARPSKTEWFQRLELLRPAPLDVPATEAVRTARAERDQELDARISWHSQ